MKKLNKKLNIKKLIELFADKTACDIQHNWCPCNTCFHSIENVDFRHICWLIILGLRGDYESEEILDEIRKELKVKGEELNLGGNNGRAFFT